MRKYAPTNSKISVDERGRVSFTTQNIQEDIKEARASLTNQQYNVLRKAGLERLMKKHDAYVSHHGAKVVVLSSPSAKFFDLLSDLFKKNAKKFIGEEDVQEDLSFGFDTMRGANEFKRKFPDTKPVQIVKVDGKKRHIVTLTEPDMNFIQRVEKAAKLAAKISVTESVEEAIEENYRDVINMFPRDRKWKQLITKHKRAIDAFRNNNKDLPKNVEDDLISWALDSGEISNKGEVEDFIDKILNEGNLEEKVLYKSPTGWRFELFGGKVIIIGKNSGTLEVPPKDFKVLQRIIGQVKV